MLLVANLTTTEYLCKNEQNGPQIIPKENKSKYLHYDLYRVFSMDRRHFKKQKASVASFLMPDIVNGLPVRVLKMAGSGFDF